MDCSTAQAISEMANRAFSLDVTAVLLVFQNKDMAAMMVYQTNPLGSERYFYAKTFLFFFQESNVAAGHVSENTLYAGGKLSTTICTRLVFS